MPNAAEECVGLTSWFLAGWPFLFVLFLFSFSGGYVICALAHASSEHYRGKL